MRIQQIIFLVAALGCLAVELFGLEIPSSALVFGLAVLVAILGLPHGSLDPLVAWRAGMWRTPAGLAAFLLFYLLLAGAAVLLWIAFPLVGLILFLAYSAFHFSGDWRDTLPLASRLATGLLIVSGPALLHGEQVTSYFTILTGDAAGSLALVRVLALAALPTVALMLVLAGLRGRPKPALMTELGVLTLCAVFLPPLIFFILYFCGLHSPRHLIETARGLKGSAIVSVGVGVTLLTVLGGAIVATWLPTGSPDERILQIVFIGLAALTVPHMLLIEHAAHPAEKPTHVPS